MSAVKKSDGLIKHFTNSAIEQQFSFFYLDDGTMASTYTFNDEEEVRTQAWYPFLEKDMVVFDIGAGYLSYALPALAAGCIVYGWSPEHEFPHIQKNVDANPGFRERCHLYQSGLYSDKGWFNTLSMEFYKELSEDKISFSRRNPAGWFIPVITLDEFVAHNKDKNKIKKIDFIKIDTEGAEVEILKGARLTIEAYRPPKILVEWHLFKDNSLRSKGEPILEELGYKPKMVLDIPRKDLPHVLYTDVLSFEDKKNKKQKHGG